VVCKRPSGWDLEHEEGGFGHARKIKVSVLGIPVSEENGWAGENTKPTGGPKESKD